MRIEVLGDRLVGEAGESLRNIVSLKGKGPGDKMGDILTEMLRLPGMTVLHTGSYIFSKIFELLGGTVKLTGHALLAMPLLPMPGGAQSVSESLMNLRKELPRIDDGMILKMPQRLTKPETNNTPETQERKAA